jgi:hypothetical protein
LLQPSSFKKPDVRAAAAKVAKPLPLAQYGEPKFFGEGTPDACATSVNAPIFADGFAFLTYSDPGGRIGAYAFKQQSGDWLVAEEVRLGFW